MKLISKETIIYLLIMFYIIVTTSGGYLLTYFVFTDKNEYISLVVLLSIMVFNLIIAILKNRKYE